MSSSGGTAATADARWEGLATLAERRGGERAYCERLLELWAAERNAPGAALYLEDDGGFAREEVVGTGAFPSYLGAEPPADLVTWRVGSGLVVVPAENGAEPSPEAPPAPASAPLHLLLAGVARALDLERRLKRQAFAVNYRVVELESLYQVGLAIASTLDLDALAEEVLLRAVSLLDARRAALYLREGGTYRRDRTFGGEARAALPVDDPGLAAFLAGDGTPPEGLLPGARFLMAVPVEIDALPRGLLVVGDKESRRGVGPFGESDRRTLSLFANQAAIALENARLHRQALEKERLERELELAAEIQRQILPVGAPEVAGFDLVGWNRPARTVGGDYYDLLPRAGGHLALVVADVSGKGIGAALLVATLHSALHLLLDQVDVGAELGERLNHHILESSAANKFITLLAGRLDPASGELTYLNAGHNPGLLLRAGGADVTELGPGGMPLGMLPGPYRVGQVRLAPGDLLCLYTDGITECTSPADEELGVGRLVACLAEHRHRPLAEIVACIDSLTLQFAADQPQLDDQTLVLLRRR
ncbi:MAG TPA: SpoIIE family protein phosphatase [Thermoanaerobaculia bacterium]|nr:SpoIIE family protein phosphatase [Thermoanaerobaculia bacterium]